MPNQWGGRQAALCNFVTREHTPPILITGMYFFKGGIWYTMEFPLELFLRESSGRSNFLSSIYWPVLSLLGYVHDSWGRRVAGQTAEGRMCWKVNFNGKYNPNPYCSDSWRGVRSVGLLQVDHSKQSTLQKSRPSGCQPSTVDLTCVELPSINRCLRGRPQLWHFYVGQFLIVGPCLTANHILTNNDVYGRWGLNKQ